MSDILVVTHRALCNEDFCARVELIAQARPAGVILREKDLSPKEYRSLAVQAMEICGKYDVPCILHSFWEIALELGADGLHMPLSLLRKMRAEERGNFSVSVLGASCHSSEDAVEAEALGCGYVTAGHVFDTGCKEGLPGRGLGFLRRVCQSVGIPVYAIGGVGPENISAVRRAGAAGACVMSSAMLCPDPTALLARLRCSGGTAGS